MILISFFCDYYWQASLGIVLGLFAAQVRFSKDSSLVILCSKFSSELSLQNLSGYSVRLFCCSGNNSQKLARYSIDYMK